AALVLGGTVRDGLGGQGQVVRAGLHRQGHALGSGLGDERQGGGAGQVQHVGTHPGAAGHVDDPRDGVVLGGVGPGGQEVGVVAAAGVACAPGRVGVLCVHDEAPAGGRHGAGGGCQFTGCEVSELLHPGGGQEGLDPEDSTSVQSV